MDNTILNAITPAILRSVYQAPWQVFISHGEITTHFPGVGSSSRPWSSREMDFPCHTSSPLVSTSARPDAPVSGVSHAVLEQRKALPARRGLKQLDLAQTLERIAARGPADSMKAKARLVENEMRAHGGLMTRGALASYRAKKRDPVRGTYRGYEIISMPPSSSGGIALIEMLNVLEGFDLTAAGAGSAQNVHLVVETMRRAFADRAQHLGDPDFNPAMPIERLTPGVCLCRHYAKQFRPERASFRPRHFTWPAESRGDDHVSVVDPSATPWRSHTRWKSYGSGIVVPGAGFLLNNEMGDFNAAPGLTTTNGLIGTAPNLAAPGKRMLSSMTPTIVDQRRQAASWSPAAREDGRLSIRCCRRF